MFSRIIRKQIMGNEHAQVGTGQQDWLWLSLLPLSLFVGLIATLELHPLPWTFRLEWVPSVGAALDWYIDGLSMQFLMLITGIGAMVFIYASGYLPRDWSTGRFYLFLLIFMVAMIGAVSADNMLLLFLCWELTSLTSFFLVGFKHTDEKARTAARQALFITLGGGLALLAGFILLAQTAGTWSLQALIASSALVSDDPRVTAALILLFIGCFTKSAQFPFHFWLPNAMSAPTPASAYLHSATMVKLGVYLLARLDPAFNTLPLWEITLIGIGTITATWAAMLALRERDLKRILARSTVSALGTLMVLIGLPFEQSALAVIAFLFAHALYKAPLFFVAGNIDHATGTRSIDHLMGLRRNMPWTTIAAVLAGMSMAGLPLSFGYVAKAVVNAAKSDAGLLATVSYGLLFVNAVAVAVAAVASIRVFWGPPNPAFSKVREVPLRMLAPPLLIAMLGLEFEFLPTLIDPLLVSAAQAMVPGVDIGRLAATHSFGSFVTAAEVTLVLGLLMFLFWERLHRLLEPLTRLDRYGPAALFEAMLKGLPRLAAWHTKRLQHGDVAGYLRVTLTVLLVIGFAAWTVTAADGPGIPDVLWNWPQQAWALAAASLLVVAGAVAAPFLQDRLALLMTIGVVGYGSAVLFLFAGAPDLAFTQFMVETVIVVVAAAVLARYGKPTARAEPRLLNGVLAIASGVLTFLLLARLFSLPANTTLAEWFAANSLDQAHGQNVVNVILVDFRAFDTFGEIAVVVFSALAAWPLLRALRKSGATR